MEGPADPPAGPSSHRYRNRPARRPQPGYGRHPPRNSALTPRHLKRHQRILRTSERNDVPGEPGVQAVFPKGRSVQKTLVRRLATLTMVPAALFGMLAIAA